MKVYIVVEEWWSADAGDDYKIIGVFLNRSDADACVADVVSGARRIYEKDGLVAFEVIS